MSSVYLINWYPFSQYVSKTICLIWSNYCSGLCLGTSASPGSSSGVRFLWITRITTEFQTGLTTRYNHLQQRLSSLQIYLGWPWFTFRGIQSCFFTAPSMRFAKERQEEEGINFRDHCIWAWKDAFASKWNYLFPNMHSRITWKQAPKPNISRSLLLLNSYLLWFLHEDSTACRFFGFPFESLSYCLHLGNHNCGNFTFPIL